VKGKRGKRSQAPQAGAASVAELNVTSSSSCALEILENRQNQEWAFDICRGWFLVEVEEEGEEKSFDGGAHRWVVFFFLRALWLDHASGQPLHSQSLGLWPGPGVGPANGGVQQGTNSESTKKNPIFCLRSTGSATIRHPVMGVV
jgi:hypothetical protein